MKILVVPDKFKFTFSSEEIGNFIKIPLIKLSHQVETIPVSDGGDGFLESIEKNLFAKRIYHKSLNANFEEIETFFLLKEKTAFLEYSKTCGLALLAEHKRNPMNTSSFGFGLQINEALKHNISKIVIGIGGSATNDAGIGMANALGVRFFDKKDKQLKPIGKNLVDISKIDFSGIKGKFENVKVIVASDVKNPLYGKNGAAYSFAAQKGANQEDIRILDRGLRNFASVMHNTINIPFENMQGAGAAGGLGAGLICFLDAKIISGANFILDLYKIEEKIKNADLIITGEGKFDEQSLNGKITGEIIKLANKHKKKAIVIAGTSSITASNENYKIISLFDKSVNIDYAKAKTKKKINDVIIKLLNEI